ncbi:MAG: cytochrome P450, partial [Pseudonocardiaceae bacterium]
TVLTDPRFSARQELRISPVRERPVKSIPPAAPGMFLGMDAPAHTRYRRALASMFSLNRISQLLPAIERVVAERLNAMRRHGPPVDLVPSFAAPIPVLVLCDLLGMPRSDAEQVRHRTTIRDNMGLAEEQRVAASETIYHYVHKLVQAERTRPTESMVGVMVTEGRLTETEVTVIAYLLIITGQETMANMLALGIFALLCHPDQWAQLRATPSLIDNAVEELLRYLTIAQFGTVRTALTDVDLDGHLIRAGEVVTVSLAAANRDPQRFDHPDVLDITRSTGGHMAFGHGIHHCLGHQLARVEMRACYTALLATFPTLCLAVEPEDISMRHDRDVYGVYQLPVAW